MKSCILALAALIAVFGWQPNPRAAAQPAVQTVRLTFYTPTGSVMRDGEWPFLGALSCSYEYPLGTVLAFPDGWQGTCLDRGALYPYGAVDVFAPSYDWGIANIEQRYGLWTEVTVVRWGDGL